ncbi:transmembrane protein, putative (macronuclear) [Tetrahymena thermophila SB210]|uniref:Transmembrane protein, putative n=1 Tax=Tetrahymena thermophila (strain SB210) TaxID=312017 RepID=I7M8U3_TETTS|nr:transmembrane protein, putative [Tetrahymena thermophila SB210]EAR99678.2 transmembrane protein, putative [Tetrahymena thermophila SB210]|eukprot:XP_001019923.2 transmembrane protein, putative [Tetrahymena thermophila SB210]
MITTKNQQSCIPLKSNIFLPKKQHPQDERGKKIDLGAPLTQTFIFSHNQKNMPRIIKETYIPEEHKIEHEEQLKNQIKVVRTEDEERMKIQDDYDFENRIRLLIEKYNSEQRDAFDIANALTEEIVKYKEMKMKTLHNNRQSARNRVIEKVTRDEQKEEEDNKKNRVEVKRLYRQIKEVVHHILEGGGEAKYKRYQQSIESKEHITLDYIKQKQKTVEEIKAATEINQLVRQFLSKKTEELDVFRQLHGEEFLTDPSILKDMSESQGESASVASDKLSKVQEELKQSEEDQKLNKFYNLTDLKVQWGAKSEYEVKENIRRILTREVLKDAERAKVKQEIEEEEIKQRLIKTDPRFARMFREQQKKKQEQLRQEQEEREKKERIKQEKIKAQLKKREQQELEQQKLTQTLRSKKPAPKQPKNPKREAENRVRRDFFDTAHGVGLVYGDVFQRTKNFGDLFQTKAKEFYNQNSFGYPNQQQSQYQQSTVDTFDGQSRFSQMEKIFITRIIPIQEKQQRYFLSQYLQTDRSLFIVQIYANTASSNKANLEKEDELIYEAIKKYENDALENNKLTICTNAIHKFMSDKEDRIRMRLENEQIQNRETILSKLYFSRIEQCLNKLRKEYPDSYITLSFIDDIKWDDYLNIDIQNLKQYIQPLTQNEIIVQKSIEKVIEEPILERDTLLTLFGFKLKYFHMPYVGILVAILLIVYAITIAFKEFIFNSDQKVRKNAHKIKEFKKKQ